MERGVYMCICVCICANNMQILGFGGVGGVRSGGGIPLGGEGGVWGSGDRAHIYMVLPPKKLTCSVILLTLPRYMDVNIFIYSVCNFFPAIFGNCSWSVGSC